MRGVLSLPALLLAGCSCGTYTVAGTDMVFDEVPLDRADYYESCGGDYGADGSFDLLGDGFALLTFAPSHADTDVDWAAIAIDLSVTFANALLVEGDTITDLGGGAALGDMSGNLYAQAGLTRGSIEVLDLGEPDPPCTPFRAQTLRLAWDLEWGAEGGPHYTAVGTDAVSVFLDGSSSDPECL